ncbi:MAG: ComF family protein [Patescibacteria group bacterium]|nr:ComF family protein [Patescibacteria group bacterium]
MPVRLIAAIYSVVVDALFPLSPAEREALSHARAPEEALKALPPAPSYAGTAVPLPECLSVFAYKDERVSRLIWAVKYKKSAAGARIGGYALWHALDGALRSAPGRPAIVVPMPITARRRRERGFNQCELLADEMARIENEAAARQNRSLAFAVDKKLLARVRHSSRQTLKGRSDRIAGAGGVFAADRKAAQRLKSSAGAARIVVIDDVITTGSTMREAIDALKAAGFGDVRGLSLAH